MRISFPALPKLLLSSTGLVSLSLCDTPHSGYNFSDAIVDCLSSLTRLEYLQIDFPSFQPPSGLASRRPATLTRTFFPVLGSLLLEGVTEYLDQFLANMGAPLLDRVDIRFFDPPIFDTSRIAQCLCLAEKFKAFDQAYVLFCRDQFSTVLSSRKGSTMLMLSLTWENSSWELLGLILDSYDCLFRSFEIYQFEGYSLPNWPNETGSAPWLHLARFLAATEYMYLSQGVAVHFAPALQELTGERATETLPVLRNIFVESLDSLGPVQESIGQFVAARQLLSGHLIDVQCWESGQ
jgi:hypothetical protein